MRPNKSQMFSRALDRYLGSLDLRWRELACAIGGLVLAIALIDWYVVPNVALGTLYVFVMLLTGMLPRRWPMPVLGVLCSFLREDLAPFRWQAGYPIRLAAAGASFMAAAFTVSLLIESRREVARHVRRLEREIELRNAAEIESRAIVDTSPVAILTTDDAGTVLMANASAERLLDPGGSLIGSCIVESLSAIAAALRRPGTLRAELECTGQRSDGETFLARVWLSKYKGANGSRAAIVVWDGSEELRSQQQAGLDGTMTASRLVLAGMAHEVRNLASAAEAAYRNVRLKNSAPDLELLGSLLSALGRLGTVGFADHSDEGTCDLASALQELKVIIEPTFAELEAEVIWPDMDGLPRLRIDHHAVLQVMLNLARNAHRALARSQERCLTIGIRTEDERVQIEFEDTGPGVSAPNQLFQPFRSHANSTGIGLYVSREILRHSGGELCYVPARSGARFVMELPTAIEVADACR